jgi:hypothetical protein
MLFFLFSHRFFEEAIFLASVTSFPLGLMRTLLFCRCVLFAEDEGQEENLSR